MGEIVLAAKCTHVPTMLMSEQDGSGMGQRQVASGGHFEIGRRARELGVDTAVICDTHWQVDAGFHINANHRFMGLFTLNEFPQIIQGMPYDYTGNPALGDAIARAATDLGVYTLAHHLDGLDLKYGTLVPMRFMSRAHETMKVVSIAARCTVHGHTESRVLGQAIASAVKASDARVLLVASGSLSYRTGPNTDPADTNGAFTISSEFNRQVDRRVLEMWTTGDHATFLKLLKNYADFCCGEGSMQDTAMLYGALGWDKYQGKCEVVTPYFPSCGTGQTNVIFPV